MTALAYPSYLVVRDSSAMGPSRRPVYDGQMERTSFFSSLLWAPLEILFVAVVLVVPGLGIWIASSLAAFEGAPWWMPALAGAFVFPLLPLGWELVSKLRRRDRKQWLTWVQRVTLRVLAVSLVFLAALVFVAPERAFTALSTRGDWMLEHARGSWVEPTRRALFRAVDGLEELYALGSGRNSFRLEAESADPEPRPTAGAVAILEDQARREPAASKLLLATGSSPSATELSGATGSVDAGSADAGTPDAGEAEEGPIELEEGEAEAEPESGEPIMIRLHESADPKPSTIKRTTVVSGGVEDQSGANAELPEGQAPAPIDTAVGGVRWPAEPSVHPIVARIPSSALSDAGAIGQFIAENEASPLGRLKAAHDFAASRIQYDEEARRTGQLPPQDPGSVLATRRAVCAGYARLVRAIGEAAKVRVAYVVGSSRDQSSETMAIDHAWNAAEVGGRWYLLDATYDAGGVQGGSFVAKYGTEYFLTPPEIFGIDHFPEDPKWQLRSAEISKAEFLRQPRLSPRFFAQGLSLVSPDRSRVHVTRAFEARIANPRGIFLVARAVPDAGGATGCVVSEGSETRISCELTTPGLYGFELFGSTERVGVQPLLGRLAVQNGL
ncbi:MAG: hypothetical protein HY791_38010 [Deltaproteobacteria bacterium]|nr:hypothetical protein [Deltaproteobacteria bacterium]